MERDFLGLSSKLSSIITVKKETNDDSGIESPVTLNRNLTTGQTNSPTRVMKNWSFLHNPDSASQLLSFGPSQQNKCRDSLNDHVLPSPIADQNHKTHYSLTQEVKIFPNSKQRNQSFINSFINHQHLDGSPIMATPISVFHTPSPINIRSSNPTCSSAATQLTIFYAGSVSVYQDITPEKAEAIMLLARNEPQAKPVTMAKSQKPVDYSPETTYPSNMPPTFLSSISYCVSDEVIEQNKTIANLASIQNNQTGFFTMAPTVGLPQTHKASLARFLEKRKERVINISPYNFDNKLPIDRKSPMSDA